MSRRPGGLRRITQETFDEAVRENIEDLEMTREEAIADAVETFEAQRVDLSNIVREGAAAGNPLLARVARIKALADLKTGQIPPDQEADACKDMLEIFRECVSSQECRAISGGNGAVEALLRVVKRAVGLDQSAGPCETAGCCDGAGGSNAPPARDESTEHSVPGTRDVIFAGVSALGTLMIRSPENRRRFGTFGEGPRVVFHVLERFPSDLALQDRGFAAVRHAISRDATNASTFAFLGVQAMILDRVREHNARNDPNGRAPPPPAPSAGGALPPVGGASPTGADEARAETAAAGERQGASSGPSPDAKGLDAKLLRQVARTAYQMTCGAGADDTKAPEYAKHFGEEELIPLLLQAATLHAGDPATVAGCCVGCEAACVKDEYCASEASQRQIPFLCGLLGAPGFAGTDGAAAAEANAQLDLGPACRLASCLAAFARNDENKKLIGTSSGVQLGVALMRRFPQSANVQLQVMKLLSAITLRQPGICEGVAACGGHSSALKAMRQHPQAAKLVRFGCLLIRNLVSRNKNLQQPILDDGAEPVLRAARRAHTICEDVAYGCLRDLGCRLGEMRNYRDTSKAMHGMFTDHDRTTEGAGAGNFSTSTKMSEGMPLDLDKAAEELGLA
jgi:hypothetical protein